MSAVYPASGDDPETLRALCARQGVEPADADLEAVQGFLRAILPALEEIERRIPPEIGTEG